MFETLDPHETDTIEALNLMFPASAEFFGAELAVLSREAWRMGDRPRRAVERVLIARARDLVADGWGVPQHRTIRAGRLRIDGNGAVWATVRHGGEHLCVLVAIEAESLRPTLNPILAAARRAGMAALGEWRARWGEREALRCANRLARNPRTVPFGARSRRAAFVPGTPEHAERCTWIETATRYRTEASWHREHLNNARLAWQSAAQRQAERAAEGGAA